MATNNLAAGLSQIGQGFFTVEQQRRQQHELERMHEENSSKQKYYDALTAKYEFDAPNIGYKRIGHLAEAVQLHAAEGKGRENDFIELPSTQEQIGSISKLTGMPPEEIIFTIKSKNDAFRVQKEGLIDVVDKTSKILDSQMDKASIDTLKSYRDSINATNTPDELDKFRKLSADFISRVAQKAGGTTTFTKADFFNPETGKLEVGALSARTGQIVGTGKEKALTPREEATLGGQFVTGNEALVAAKKAAGQAPETGAAIDQNVINRPLQKGDQKVIEKAITGFDQQTKEERDALNAALGLKALANTKARFDIPNAFGIRINKYLRNPGALTEQERIIFTKYGSIMNRMIQAVQSKTSMTLTEETKKNMLQMLTDLETPLTQAIDKRISVFSSRVESQTAGRVPSKEAAYRIDTTQAERRFGSLGGTEKNSDMVRVTSPSGQTGSIPRANLEKAKAAGYKEAQ